MNNLAALPFCPYRYALITSYIGTKYHGSQRLTARGKIGDLPTVQEALETCLEEWFPKQKCGVTAGSRTDKGVHALMNVYTLPLMDFKTPTSKLRFLLNQALIKRQHDIILKDVLLVSSLFHPRKSCISREYIYRIAVPRKQKFLHFIDTSSHKPNKIAHLLPITELYRSLPLPQLDLDKAQQVVDILNGEHDFLSFCFSPKPDDDTIRTMEVRRMVGALITYATYNRITFDSIKKLLDEPSRSAWNPNLIVAEPYGLYLRRLNYNKSSFHDAKRTHEDQHDEVVDAEDVEGSSDDNIFPSHPKETEHSSTPYNNDA